MNTPTKIQIHSNLSNLAKAHQELLAHFETTNAKAHAEDKPAPHEGARVKTRSATSTRRQGE
jgi:hypothetical protein